MLKFILEHTQNQTLSQELQFIIEADKIKQIMRRTLLTDGSRRENDAEHSWHLALMAIVLKNHAKESFSMERVLKMLIIHDLIEIYAGDTFAFDPAGNANKRQREQQAANRLFSILPENQETEIRNLWEEFDNMETADAAYASALDRLQPFIHNMLTDGHTWKEGAVTMEQVLERSAPIMKTLPSLEPLIKSCLETALDKGWIKK